MTAIGKNSGFTLIELLVVIVVVSVLAAVTTFNIGDQRLRELKNEVKRLHAVLKLASDEAIFQGREFGMSIEPDQKRYQFWRFDYEAKKWQAEESEAFTSYTFPSDMVLELELEGETIDLTKVGKKDEKTASVSPSQTAEEKSVKPAILFLSSGEMTPFEIALRLDRRDSPAYTLHTDGLQAVQMRYPGDDDD